MWSRDERQSERFARWQITCSRVYQQHIISMPRGSICKYSGVAPSGSRVEYQISQHKHFSALGCTPISLSFLQSLCDNEGRMAPVYHFFLLYPRAGKLSNLCGFATRLRVTTFLDVTIYFVAVSHARQTCARKLPTTGPIERSEGLTSDHFWPWLHYVTQKHVIAEWNTGSVFCPYISTKTRLESVDSASED